MYIKKEFMWFMIQFILVNFNCLHIYPPIEYIWVIDAFDFTICRARKQWKKTKLAYRMTVIVFDDQMPVLNEQYPYWMSPNFPLRAVLGVVLCIFARRWWEYKFVLLRFPFPDHLGPPCRKRGISTPRVAQMAFALYNKTIEFNMNADLHRAHNSSQSFL